MPDGSSSGRVSPDGELSFADLVQARIELRGLAAQHADSVNYFAFDRGFRRTTSDVASDQPDEPPDIRDLRPDEELSGVTTSFTCFESLQERLDVDGRDRQRFRAFAESALDRPTEWRSEGAARRYCIVRAAGPIVDSGIDLDTDRRGRLADLIREVWSVTGDDAEIRGVYEIAPPPTANPVANRPLDDLAPATVGGLEIDGAVDLVAASPSIGPSTVPPPEYRYPPNAFLTYWAIRALRGLDAETLKNAEMQHRMAMAEAWLYGVVGREVALHFDRASGRDPQQLAWAVCGVVHARDLPLNERSEGTQELVRAGLRAFFEQQLDDGTWDRGRALFHYPEAGNAYCYVMETLAELAALALDPVHPAAGQLRRDLRPYLWRLLRAKDHLVQTARELGPGLQGWSSNHHPHRPAPESWATGTAYRFLQLLRRLVGLEVRSRALIELQATVPRESLDTLRRRGGTWDAGLGTAGDLLASLFVHPAAALDSSNLKVDPDRTIFDDTRARSAILFGPPGTGKTILAESVAGALKWDFVEITPADFLDHGMDLVSARADEIFKQLMELDRCVVLLDEIDELIRARRSTADPLERFFTTTMLPRLARLWKLGKVIFFVNTNSISDIDPAVRRSQRFDAAILVMPPSLYRKMAMLPAPAQEYVDTEVLLKILGEYDLNNGVVSTDEARIGWFAFLRYDQMLRLAKFPSDDRHAFLEQIERLGRELLSSDWALSLEEVEAAAPTSASGSLNDLQLLIRAYKIGVNFQRIDSGRLRAIRVCSDGPFPAAMSEELAPGYRRLDDANTDGSMVPLNGAGEFAPG